MGVVDLVGLLVYDPKEFNDPQAFDDPKGISIESMYFDIPKVYGDTSIFDGLVILIILTIMSVLSLLWL